MVICKESSKPSKLSTKLSTIWQINDYLSKKIDNRLIVDIIDTPGHPAWTSMTNLTWCNPALCSLDRTQEVVGSAGTCKAAGWLQKKSLN